MGRIRSVSLGQLPNDSPIGMPTPLTPGSLGSYAAHGLEIPFATGSGMAIPDLPPPIDASKKAMEEAVQKERTRMKALEKEEVGLSADELHRILRRERTRMSRMAADLAAMKSAAVQSIAEAEAHEEGRINNLMRRLDSLQLEKGRIIVELEREEEMLTNNLQKKLEQVRREKTLLEQQVEREQSAHSKLKFKLAELRNTQDVSMAEVLEEEDEMEQET